MWNFIKSLLSNHLGIVLGTLNMCCLIHIFLNHFPLRSFILHKMIVGLNFPALFLGIFTLESFNLLFLHHPDYRFIQSAEMVLPVFVPLQWLFIGWLAKIIAQNIIEHRV